MGEGIGMEKDKVGELCRVGKGPGADPGGRENKEGKKSLTCAHKYAAF